MAKGKQHIRTIQLRLWRTDKGFLRLYKDEYCFSPGCYSFTKNGECLFIFTPKQATFMELIVDHIEQGIYQVPQSWVLARVADDDASKDSRLRDYFREHPAWGTFIKTTPGRDSKVFLDFSIFE